MPINPAAVDIITVPELASAGLTADTLIPHQVVAGTLKKATLAVFTAYFQANLTLVAKTVITKSHLDVLTDADGLFYIDFKDEAGAPFAAGLRPYSVESKTGAITTPIPALLYNNDAWAFPRIYNFPDPLNTQAIKLYII